MRTRAMVLGLCLILVTASPIPAEELSSVGSIDEPGVDWEGVATPTLIYEGQLSDPQDIDEIALGDEGYFAFHFQVKRIFASSSYLDALLAGQ